MEEVQIVKRGTLIELLMFVLLVTTGVTLRLYFQDIPNFAPVAAMALFAGYFFRSSLLALCVPMSVMTISDAWIGGYHPVVMITVYAMLALPVAMRGLLRRRLPLHSTSGRSSRIAAVAGLSACSLCSSVLFFVVTNFATWVFFGGYERSLSGLVNCYVQAIPFFRYTLMGDMLFATVLFGGYALALRFFVVVRSHEVAIAETA